MYLEIVAPVTILNLINPLALPDAFREVGPVIEAFRLNHKAKYDSIMKEYAGRAAIGHVRYATCGSDDRSYAQPFERHHGCKWKWFTFAFNGQLANYSELRDFLLSKNEYHLTRNTDTEILMHYLGHELRGEERPDLVQVFRNLSEKFDGAYNIVFMNAMGDMAVVRDPVSATFSGVLGSMATASWLAAGRSRHENLSPERRLHHQPMGGGDLRQGQGRVLQRRILGEQRHVRQPKLGRQLRGKQRHA